MPTSEMTTELIPQENPDIRSMIYTIRGQQVMLDSDLAFLYQVETKVFNQAVKRNSSRFPERFCFQLTQEEFDSLRSQSVTSNGKGGRRYLPYAFTERGILSAAWVLKSDIAVAMSIKITDEFVEMRKFIASQDLLLNRIIQNERRQEQFQLETQEKFNQIMALIPPKDEFQNILFFNGQMYDAFAFLVQLVQKAATSIVLIDGYTDSHTLNILSKKQSNVKVTIYTFPNSKLSSQDVSVFNSQYPSLTVKTASTFHDRFLILDDKEAYGIGASLKDAGKKSFAIHKIEDADIVLGLVKRLENGT